MGEGPGGWPGRGGGGGYFQVLSFISVCADLVLFECIATVSSDYPAEVNNWVVTALICSFLVDSLCACVV